MRASTPDRGKRSSRPRGRALLRASFLVPASLALLVVVVAVSLHPLARSRTRAALDRLEGAHGEFLDARLSLFPLRYTVTHLKIRNLETRVQEPFFYAESVAVDLRWASLFRGRLIGSIDARGVKMVIEQPKPGSTMRLPSLSDLVPVAAVVERLQLTKGEVLYAWVREENQPTLWFQEIEATLENLGSRPGLTEGPLVLAARGQFARQGMMRVTVTAEPYATPLVFAGEAVAENLDLSQMNPYIAATKGVKLTPGAFSMRMSFASKNGRLTGTIDPHLTGTEIQSADEDLGSALKALLGKISLSVSGPTEGTRPSGRIAVSDDFRDPSLQFVLVLEKTIENGFLLGMQEGLKRAYSGPPGKQPDQAKPEATPLKTQQK
ncbi:MAG: DUF748 domain-containing protein [Myxococcaceae bacterium]|nr:MAG: DUF748 domain-containing protein [Myxococcaceae bacterium]